MSDETTNGEKLDAIHVRQMREVNGSVLKNWETIHPALKKLNEFTMDKPRGFVLQRAKAWDLCGVITLPEGMFYMTANTTTRADVVHLRRKSANTSSPAKVYFANAPTVGMALNSRDTQSADNALEEVATAVRASGCVEHGRGGKR
jgi:hypothetical protein